LADVLAVAALQLGHPVSFSILMKSDDSTLHPSPFAPRPQGRTMPLLERASRLVDDAPTAIDRVRRVEHEPRRLP